MGKTNEDFDVIVIGARCAGSPLATMLAHEGLQVCLLDRATFPSDALSTHLIQPCGVEVLERLGLVEELLEAGVPVIDRFSLIDNEIRIDADADRNAFGLGICLRRIKLDHLLVEAAAAAGADVRTGTSATDLVREAGRVVGVRTRERELRATLVVGADGRSSLVAQRAGASEYRVEPAGRLISWGYFRGAGEAERRLRLAKVADIAYLSVPTDSGLFLAGVCPPIESRDEYLADREAGFAAGVEAWPELAGLLAGAERVGSIRVLADWNGYYREATGPGWVLVGDAGHFKDPTPFQGIADALRQAERLASSILAGLAEETLDESLRRWWRWRDEDSVAMYDFASDSGSNGSRLVAAQLLRQIGGESDGGEQLLSVFNRELRPSQLFAPRRAARAVGTILRDDPHSAVTVAKEIADELRKGRRRRREAVFHHRPTRPIRL